MMYLEDASLEYAVLRPRPREVFHARHLDEGSGPGGFEAPQGIAVRVPTKIANQLGPAPESTHEPEGTLEVEGVPLGGPAERVSLPARVVAEDHYGPVRT